MFVNEAKDSSHGRNSDINNNLNQNDEISVKEDKEKEEKQGEEIDNEQFNQKDKPQEILKNNLNNDENILLSDSDTQSISLKSKKTSLDEPISVQTNCYHQTKYEKIAYFELLILL